MDFELNQSQLEIVKQVGALCDRFPDEYWRDHDEKHEFPSDFFKAVADSGYLGVAIPEQYGGSGLGITEAALVMREVASSGGAMAAPRRAQVDVAVSPGLLPRLRTASRQRQSLSQKLE